MALIADFLSINLNNRAADNLADKYSGAKDKAFPASIPPYKTANMTLKIMSCICRVYTTLQISVC